MLKMSSIAGPLAVFGVVAAWPALASANELQVLAAPAARLVAGLSEPSSLLVLGSVLAGLAYIIDGRQGRS